MIFRANPIVAALGTTGIALVLFRSVVVSGSPIAGLLGKGIYFAPASLPLEEDLPRARDVFPGAGITTVHSEADLRHSAASVKPVVVILHREILPEVDRNWIRDQYRAGIIVVGVNVTMRELARLLADPGIRDIGQTDDWYEKPYYSYAVRRLRKESTRRELEEGTQTPSHRVGKITPTFSGAVARNVADAGILVQRLNEEIKGGGLVAQR